MKLFLHPTKFKLVFTVSLLLYVIIGVLLLASLNTTRSIGTEEYSFFYSVLVILSIPAMFLGFPGLVVAENNFGEYVFLRIISGLLVEILFLYGLACVFGCFRKV